MRRKRFQYKKLLIIVVVFATTLYLSQLSIVQSTLTELGEWGYVGAVFAGIFFGSLFTVAPATVALIFLGSYLNPVVVALLGGFGSIFGDYVILRFFKDGLFDGILPTFRKSSKKSFLKRHGVFVRIFLRLLGVVLLIVPGPDEMGIGLLGLSKIKVWQFVLLIFTLNSISLYLILLAARALSG